MVEPDRNGHPNLLQQVRKYIKSNTTEGDQIYAQHIHRLDRPVSGIILFAKRKSVLKNLSEQFAERKVKKYYEALTEKCPDNLEGQLEHWHRKEKKKALLYSAEIPFSEKAVLNYKVFPHTETTFYWEIELHTGKFHQIRAQLSSVGCPIIGDTYYGSTAQYVENCIMLHACKLAFAHPITHESIVLEKAQSFDLKS